MARAALLASSILGRLVQPDPFPLARLGADGAGSVSGRSVLVRPAEQVHRGPLNGEAEGEKSGREIERVEHREETNARTKARFVRSGRQGPATKVKRFRI